MSKNKGLIYVSLYEISRKPSQHRRIKDCYTMVYLACEHPNESDHVSIFSSQGIQYYNEREEEEVFKD